MQSNVYSVRFFGIKKYLSRRGGSRIRARSNLVNIICSTAGHRCGVILYFKMQDHKVGITSNNLEQDQKRLFSKMKNEKNMEKGNNNDNVITVLKDNPCFFPCWGSPTRFHLEDLLSFVDRSNSIVYDSPQYLVLNKPPDLRMDGPYSATVHKLLTYWYPPPSLSSLAKCKPKISAMAESERIMNSDIDDNGSYSNTLLLKAVSQLHQHNDVEDNFLRPCHQLDYATSGILLVAKTQEAAAHISRLFEERHESVQKSYMAIVVGDLRKGLLCYSKENESEISNKTNPKVPIWTGGTTTREVREQLRRLEEAYRRSRAAEGKQHRRVRDASKNQNQKKDKRPSFTGCTFQGFQPAHSIFAKWKSKLKLMPVEKRLVATSQARTNESSRQKKRQKRRKLKNHSASSLLTDDDWQRIWDPVNDVVGATTSVSAAGIEFQTLEWKQLEKEHPTLKQAIIRATDLHNDILRHAIGEKEQQKNQEEVGKKIEGDFSNCGKELPTLFRLSKDSETGNDSNYSKHCVNNSAIDDNTFYICCPLAQHPEQFNMHIPTSVARAYPNLTIPPSSYADCNKDSDTINAKNNQLKFRPSLTKCTILERGTLSIVRDNTETKIDLTKVRLHPMTGRRHQLRVHMALTGFPILGDVAYGGDIHAGRERDPNNDEREHSMEIDTCSRMCLHAQFLQLPTLLGESKPDWKIATSDPFAFGSDGKLI